MGDLIRVIFYQPAFNILVFFYRLFGDNLGLAIIMLAIVTRLITYPMTQAQLKSAEKSKKFQAQFDKLKKKYAKNKQKLNEEMAKLQAQFLPGQLAGCLPMILLIIFLFQVRNVINSLVEEGSEAFNKVAYPFISHFALGSQINFRFLGMDLSRVATDFKWTEAEIIPYVLLAVFVGLTQYFSTKILTGIRSLSDEKKVIKQKEDKKKNKKKAEDEMDMSSMMGMMNKQMAFLFPAMTTITSLGYWGGAKFFPSGISIFWTVQNLFVIIQQLIRNRKDVSIWLKKKLGKIENEKMSDTKKQIVKKKNDTKRTN